MTRRSSDLLVSCVNLEFGNNEIVVWEAVQLEPFRDVDVRDVDVGCIVLTCLVCAVCHALTPIKLEGRRYGYEYAGQ